MRHQQTRHRALTATAVLASVFSVAGCSSLPASLDVPATVPTEIAAVPATGQTISGTGYSFAVPEGWSSPPGITVPEADLAIGNPTDTDGFTDNIVVVLAPAEELTPDWIESRGVEALEDGAATKVEVRNRVMIGGSESPHLAAIFSNDDTEYQVEQFYVRNDVQLYVVTFSFSLAVPEADRDSLAESVLASWAWA